MRNILMARALTKRGLQISSGSKAVLAGLFREFPRWKREQLVGGGRREEGAEGSKKRGEWKGEEGGANIGNLHLASVPAFSQGPGVFRF